MVFSPSIPYWGIGNKHASGTEIEYRIPLGSLLFLIVFISLFLHTLNTTPLEVCSINGVKYPIESSQCGWVLPFMYAVPSLIVIFNIIIVFLGIRKTNKFFDKKQ